MLAIVQARLSSERLPGKMLLDLCGKPMLRRVVDRLSGARRLTRIMVATSSERSDDALAEYCEREGIDCHRGPLDNVAERFRQAAARAQAPAFVRINGDSPLMDPAIVDQAIACFELQECDLATNVLVRSFPKGQSVEVLRAETFGHLCASLTTSAQKEHVTQAFYEHPARFRIVSFTSGADAGTVNLSVDTPADFERAERLITGAGGRTESWRELLERSRTLEC